MTFRFRSVFAPWALFLLLFAGFACSEDNAPPQDADTDVLEIPSEIEDTGENDATAEAFLIAVISDSHVQLSNDSEQNLNFVHAAEEIGPLGPDFIVNTGDLVDDLFCFPDINCDDPLPVLVNYQDLIESSYDVPLYNVIGNHDNRYFDTFETRARPAASWDYVFGDTPSLPSPYYAVEHKGFQFLMLDATDLAVDHDTNDDPSFGQEQLDWTRKRLETGLPTLMFWHHFIDPHEEVLPDAQGMIALIDEYQDRVLAVFMGHKHYFAHVEWNGVSFYMTDDLKHCEEPVYHLVRLDPAARTLTIVNEDDIEYR